MRSHALTRPLRSRARVVLEAAIAEWFNHEGPRLAASLSFYTLLSLAPLVILTIAITSFAFGVPAAQQAIVHQVATLVGADGVRAVRTVMTHASSPQAGRWGPAVGVCILLFGASSVFGELQSALNKIWEVDRTARRTARAGVTEWIRSRLFSFAMVLALGFLSIVSLITTAALTALGDYFRSILSAPPGPLQLTNTIFSLCVIATLLAVILKYVPDVEIPWRHVFTGAAVTAVLFTIGKWLIGLYLGSAAVGSAYGAAGSLVVVIVWVYYSAMIFYFGAELTRAEAADAGWLSSHRFLSRGPPQQPPRSQGAA